MEIWGAGVAVPARRHDRRALAGARRGGAEDRRPRDGGAALDRASASTVARLSNYYRVLGEFDSAGIDTVASKKLAERVGVTSAQVRKDLSFFGNFGRRGLGYGVSQLRAEIARILGLGRRWRVALVGAGNLGQALFTYAEFRRQGFHIEHLFDVDAAKIGRNWDGVPIEHLDRLPDRATDPGIDIAIVAVPPEAAVSVMQAVTRAGIRAILSFAPGSGAVPAGVAVREVDLSIAMESLSYALVK